MRSRKSGVLRLSLLLTICSLLASGCASLPAEFWTKDRDFSALGLYNVSQLGLSGFGTLNYTSKKVDDEKLTALQEQIETLTKVVYAIVAKLHEEKETSRKGAKAQSGSLDFMSSSSPLSCTAPAIGGQCR